MISPYPSLFPFDQGGKTNKDGKKRDNKRRTDVWTERSTRWKKNGERLRVGRRRKLILLVYYHHRAIEINRAWWWWVNVYAQQLLGVYVIHEQNTPTVYNIHSSSTDSKVVEHISFYIDRLHPEFCVIVEDTWPDGCRVRLKSSIISPHFDDGDGRKSRNRRGNTNTHTHRWHLLRGKTSREKKERKWEQTRKK